MSYFEYNISGDLTPEYEEKTKLILSKINDGTGFYNIQKYWDEDVTPEKKQRVIVLTSPVNVSNHLYELIKDSGLYLSVYYKQRII